MEDDFYATIKFKNGEEIFAKVAASEEEDRTMLVISHPITTVEIKQRGQMVGYKVEPWLKTTKEIIMEDDFYGTIKFKNGEEIFAKIAASEETDRTMLVIHHPIIVSEIKTRAGTLGYKVEPWLKTTREDMFIINMDNVLTMSESSDIHMIQMYQRFVQDTDRDSKNKPKISRKMGYIATVNDAKDILEKLYKSSPHKESSS